MKASKITIARLYNLGNYEHVRYEITVEVPPDQSAERALRGLGNILEGLNPAHYPKIDLEEAGRKIQRLIEWTEEQVEQRYGEKKADLLARWQADLEEARQAQAQQAARRDECLAALDDVGGIAERKDAKQDWDDRECED